MSAWKNLLVEIIEPVAILTLNRPHKRNALSLELIEELLGALEEVAASTTVRAVILAASGPVFCSGHDLTEMTGRSARDYRQLYERCTRLMLRLQSIPQPVIAEVQGLATAAGCQLVASCDLAVASEQAGFATPGVKIGLFCSTPMVALSRLIGRRRALEMLLTGRVVDARTALEWGLVNRVVPAGQLRETSMELAQQIAAASPLTVSLGKRAFYWQCELDQERAYAYAVEVMTLNSLSEDAQEGITAFLEKRPPCWKNR